MTVCLQRSPFFPCGRKIKQDLISKRVQIAHTRTFGINKKHTMRSSATPGLQQQQEEEESSKSLDVAQSSPTQEQQQQEEQEELAIPEELTKPLDVPRPTSVPWEDVILFQSFDWESSKHKNVDWYDTVKALIPDLKAAGITHCWLPPPAQSVSQEGYLPTQLYDLNSAYGTIESLVALNTALMAADIRPIADIVINHRCADEQNEDGVWNQYSDDVPNHPGRRIDWGPEAIVGDDPNFEGEGHEDQGDTYEASPNLDHKNKNIRAGLVDWMRWLRDYIGFEGYRMDYVKGFAPDAAKHYLEKSVRSPGKDFCVAEYWIDAAWEGSTLVYNQDEMRQGLCDYVTNTGRVTAVFDFATKACLQEAIRNTEYDRLRDKDGQPPGLCGWMPERACTFIDNHDTGGSQNHWPFPEDGILQGYAYMLTHPGIPCIFYDHYSNEELKPEICKLVELRQRAGINAASKIDILAADKDVYIARIDDAVVIKMGPRYDMGEFLPEESEGWEMVLTGNDWAIWEKKKA